MENKRVRDVSLSYWLWIQGKNATVVGCQQKEKLHKWQYIRRAFERNCEKDKRGGVEFCVISLDVY